MKLVDLEPKLTFEYLLANSCINPSGGDRRHYWKLLALESAAAVSLLHASFIYW